MYLKIIIAWNLADVWHIIFSSDPTNILLCVGIGIGYKKYSQIKDLCEAYPSNLCNKIPNPS